ncbi:helix-turn-helix domain-containing protein [Culicoidibacter larvae]|uniref:Helix-turn-helix transcriptional regulator n=1 Tax=Culicoidibacter larvae TaxID=2579976 RepID=A0A5R8QB86_9FIRM|nr:helix-turn-helix transcriptional regulator [Culicoidibacter larvae]TLG72578.1 helix-turn-helix transcriptional regulator [Culicoidibacter larvae]
MNVDFKIGNHIKSIRVAKNISQAELCNDICSVATLVRIEANKQSPSFELVIALLNRMGVSIDSIIARTNYSNSSFYYALKDSLITANDGAHWHKLSTQLQLINDELYQSLPIIEQQFIDIMRINAVKFVDKDFELAYSIAKNALAKTFNPGSFDFFSHEELRLINALLQFDHSPEHLVLTHKALEWAEKQPESVKDYPACMLLLTGLLITSYMQGDWQNAFHYASRGYKMAITKNGFKFVPNFLFAQGMSLYQLNTDLERARLDMKEALHFCYQYEMPELYDVLLQDIREFNIELEKDN